MLLKRQELKSFHMFVIALTVSDILHFHILTVTK